MQRMEDDWDIILFNTTQYRDTGQITSSLHHLLHTTLCCRKNDLLMYHKLDCIIMMQSKVYIPLHHYDACNVNTYIDILTLCTQ